jgi:ABC-type phosphate/phosphonate transport system substrate-binding protein
MSRANAEVVVGAVAYHPRIVTIWESFLGHFDAEGITTDYVLYSNYERLVDALLAGRVDIAWNTNTAFVATEQRLGGDEARILGMRDVDAEFATVIVTRRGEGFEDSRRAGGPQAGARQP